LIENATLSSPSGTRVEVRAERVANGFAIEIDDRGLGIEAGHLRTINQQLAQPPDFDLANADQLGLFVVGKLAARHGVRVALRPSPYGGTTAVVLMPNSIVVPTNEADPDTQPDLRPAAGRTPGLDLSHADALALTGRHSAQPSLSADATGETETVDGNPRLTRGSTGTAPGRSGFGPGFPTRVPGASGFSSPVPDSSGFPTPGPDAPGFPTRKPDSSGFSTPGPDAPGFPTRKPGASGFSIPGPDAPGPATDANDNAGPVARPQTGGTYRGLPRRVRQASLNPH